MKYIVGSTTARVLVYVGISLLWGTVGVGQTLPDNAVIGNLRASGMAPSNGPPATNMAKFADARQQTFDDLLLTEPDAKEIPPLFSARRSASSREMALIRYDGEYTHEAVLRALRWLAVNQAVDGSWGKTKPAMTALALLAYLAHGETIQSQEFGHTVGAALLFLIDAQEPDGHFEGRDAHDYTQPIAAYALSEAYGMTRNPTVKAAAIKALSEVVKGQHPGGGFDYNLKPSSRNDMSYMGWCVQALKAGEVAGLMDDVDGLGKAIRWAALGVRKNYGERNGEGGFGYTIPGRSSGLSGAGVLCLQLLGQGKSQEVRSTLPMLQVRYAFNWDRPPSGSVLYYWSYITQAFFHEGGAGWRSWNKQFSKPLVAAQHVVGRDRSSYVDHANQPQETGYWISPAEREHNGGNGEVMDTILCTLMLEVYYRTLPLAEKEGTDL